VYRLPSLGLLGCLSIALQGCATGLDPASYTAPVAEEIRRSARTVEVVSIVPAADRTAPRLDVKIGQGKGAATGAAAGAGAGLITGVMVSAAGGPLGPALAPVVIPVFTLGGMVGGGAFGWSLSVPARDADAANAALSRSRSDLSAEVARRVESHLPSIGKVAEPAGGAGSPDLRVEVSVDRWGLAGGVGSDPVTGFYVAASYRVARASDRTTLVERRFIEGGPQRPVSEWTRDDAALLSRAVDAALSRVAEAAADGTFLVHDFHVLKEGGGVVRGEVCGLKPDSPPPLFRFGPYESGSPRVRSLTPRFVWESFPGRKDVEADAGRILARVSDVRYDLRIWKNERGGPGELVYERRGLVLPGKDGAVGHTVETPLAAGSRYLWSTRARFHLDAEERVTRWSYDLEVDLGAVPLGFFDRRGSFGVPAMDPYRQGPQRRRPCVEDSIPPLHYFSFTTP